MGSMEQDGPSLRRRILTVLGLLLAAAVGSVLLGFVLGLGRPRPRLTRTGA